MALIRLTKLKSETANMYIRVMTENVCTIEDSTHPDMGSVITMVNGYKFDVLETQDRIYEILNPTYINIGEYGVRNA